MSSTTSATSTSLALSIATAPTCFVVSLPPHVSTYTFTSGQYDILAKTTYTALSLKTLSFAATTDATCVEPGQLIPTATVPGLTPSIATASICVVVTNPQEINTVTHSSGETGLLFPATTYTASSVRTLTRSARTDPSFYTPGENIPALTVPTMKEGIICSTSTHSAETLTYTYTPGVEGFVFKTSRTAAETSTSIIPAFTETGCSVIPD